MANESMSGQYAILDGVGNHIDWTLARTRPTNGIRHAGTRGGRYRSIGVGSWNGSWNCEGSVPAVNPGESFSFLGYVGPGSHIPGTSGPTYSGLGVANEASVEWDFTNNALIKHSVSFDGHLGLTYSNTGIALSAPTAGPSNEPSGNCQMVFDGAQITDIRTASLKISAEVPSFINSSTAGETGRVPSSLVDWEASFVVERGDMPIPEGTIGLLEMYVNATDKYALAYGIVREYSGFTANRESGEVIAQTLTIEMITHNATGSLGSITLPRSSTAFWPQ